MPRMACRKTNLVIGSLGVSMVFSQFCAFVFVVTIEGARYRTETGTETGKYEVDFVCRW